MDFIAATIHILAALSVAVYFAGALLLVVRSRSRSDRRALGLLAFNLSMWGLAALPGAIGHGPSSSPDFPTMSVFVLTFGNIYAIFCLLYPLEYTRPGWFGLRNVVRLFLPCLTVTAVFFAGTIGSGTPFRRFGSPAEMMLFIGEFGTWFRFVLYLMLCSYLVYLLRITLYPDFPKAARSADASADRRRIVWLHGYGIGNACIMGAYLPVMLFGSPASILVHKVVTLLFFSYTIVQALRVPEPACIDKSEEV